MQWHMGVRAERWLTPARRRRGRQRFRRDRLDDEDEAVLRDDPDRGSTRDGDLCDSRSRAPFLART